MADLISEGIELGVLKDWRENYVDPTLTRHSVQIGELLSFRDSTQGKFTIIVWLFGVMTTLQVALMTALFGWALSHVTLKVMTDPATIAHHPQPTQSTNDFGAN